MKGIPLSSLDKVEEVLIFEGINQSSSNQE